MNKVIDLAIIVPTYNESENVKRLVGALSSVLENVAWEVVFVDDNSADGTATKVRELSLQDQRVRGLQRIGRRGLSSACIEGILSTSTPVICIMDADLQHDETILPDMYHAIHQGYDLVIGSRYIDNASTGMLSPLRTRASQFATALSHVVLRHKVADPMSGFFMLRRSLFESVMYGLYGKGFKILLDILTSTSESIKITEIPYTMRNRQYGESKLSVWIMWHFLTLLINKLVLKAFHFRT